LRTICSGVCRRRFTESSCPSGRSDPHTRWTSLRGSGQTGLALRSRQERTAPPPATYPRLSCHERAIHGRPGWSPADNHGQRQGGLDLRRSLPSQVTDRPDLALQAGGRTADACIGLAVPGRAIRSRVAEGPASPTASATGGERADCAELGHLVVAISSDGVVLQGGQHPSGRVAHDLPLLVGQLGCAVLHHPGDPWQVMDHPRCEPLAR
jgi:hypothetical protein